MSEPLTRLRIYFAKNAAARFTSHLDIFQTWIRTFRRAGVRLAYRHSYNPQPRMNIASALPLGCTSQAEILDVWIENFIPTLDELILNLSKALPAGLEIIHIQEIDLSEPPLQSQIDSAEYCLTFLDPIPEVNSVCQSMLQADSLVRDRRGKSYDLRPLIYDLQPGPLDSYGRQTVIVRLGAREGATGRPDEIVSALGANPENTLIHRTQLFFI